MTEPSSKNEVAEYFNQIAKDYFDKSISWPWSWLRRREVNAVRLLLAIRPGSKVLEFGSGSGYYTRLLLCWGASHVIAVDVSREMISRLPSLRVTGVIGDAANTIVDGKYEYILALGLLEFVHSPMAVLSNIGKNLADNGSVLILVPEKGFFGILYKLFHRRHGIKIHLFTRTEIEALTRNVGWEISI